MKRRGKRSKGYTPGDPVGNFLRASFFGVAKPFIDDQPPFNAVPNPIIHFILLQCFDYPKPKSQARFYTCRQLTQMAKDHLRWQGSERQMRNICRVLGIELLPALKGRPPGTENRKF